MKEMDLWVRKKGKPVLTLWAAVAAEVLGFENDETLTPLAGICKADCLLKGGR
jgi:hypothetical protein